MTRGVFHRQGPFMGFGDLYGPDPAIALVHRLAAMWRPPNDALTSSWVSAGPSSNFVKADSPASLSRGTSIGTLAPMTMPC